MSKKQRISPKSTRPNDAAQQPADTATQQEALVELSDTDLKHVVGGIMKTKHDTVKNSDSLSPAPGGS